jgi:two-component system, cell cycle sensor histidine kinase and response regulator CckA
MKTILVLEDDLGNMQAFCAVLSSMGDRVLEATTGKEAIETSNNLYEPINLFVSDVSLPDLSGTEVALRLIQLQSDLPILFLSGTPINDWPESDRRNFRQLLSGSVDFLEKPFHASALQTKVESLVNSQSFISDARR